MAGVNSKSQIRLDLEMTCCLGDHPLNNPKLLPCHHSFCTDCIKTKVKPNKKEFTCPKCQLSIPLTGKEVEHLPDDVLFHIQQESRGLKADCVMCQFENKKSLGTFQCLDCGEITCDECKSGHTKSAITRLHRVVSMKEIKDGKYKNEQKAAKQLACDTHSEPNTPMFLQLYCEDCKCLACQICAITDHQPKGHTCRTIKDIYDEKTTALTAHVTKLLELKILEEEFAGKLETSQGQNQELKEKLENEVYQRAAHLIEVIEKVKEKKLDQIRGHFQNEDTSIQFTFNETKNRIIRTDRIVNYIQDFIEQGSKSEFLQNEDKLRENLTNHLQEKLERKLKTNSIELCDQQIETLEDVIFQAFGEIRMTKKEVSIADEKDVPHAWIKEPKVLFSVESDIGQAWDLTVTENEDIVAVSGSTIQVYNSEGKHKERINCSQLQNAWNVVAKGDKLYVSNWNANGNILVIDFKGNVKKTITLPETSQKYSNKGLAVDDEGNVYISSYGAHTIYKCEENETKAKVFIPKGTHPDLKGPKYLNVTPNGEVVISNRDSSTLHVYDINGEFLWQYKGQGEQKLNCPQGVSCDVYGYIYIANYHGNSIEIIRDGELQKRIMVQNIAYPYGIDLDKDRNIVCINNGGKTIMKIKIWE